MEDKLIVFEKNIPEKRKHETMRGFSRDIKHSITSSKNGYFCGNSGGYNPSGRVRNSKTNLTEPRMPKIMKFFGCLKCSWAGSMMCPHKIMIGSHHHNYICKDRIDYIKEEFQKIRDVPRLVQQEEAVKLKLMTEHMLFDWAETGELNEEYKHLNKNLIILIDKMRRQDEGIKIQEDISIEVRNLRNLIDTQAEVIQETDILEYAKKIENADKQDNGPGEVKPSEEI